MIQFVALKSASSKMQTYSDCLIIFFFLCKLFSCFKDIGGI